MFPTPGHPYKPIDPVWPLQSKQSCSTTVTQLNQIFHRWLAKPAPHLIPVSSVFVSTHLNPKKDLLQRPTEKQPWLGLTANATTVLTARNRLHLGWVSHTFNKRCLVGQRRVLLRILFDWTAHTMNRKKSGATPVSCVHSGQVFARDSPVQTTLKASIHFNNSSAFLLSVFLRGVLVERNTAEPEPESVQSASTLSGLHPDSQRPPVLHPPWIGGLGSATPPRTVSAEDDSNLGETCTVRDVWVD